jgi:hypothetical protein
MSDLLHHHKRNFALSCMPMTMMIKTVIRSPTTVIRAIGVCLWLSVVIAFSPLAYPCLAPAGFITTCPSKDVRGISWLNVANENASDEVRMDPIQLPPPPPSFTPKPLPVILGAGLFLFASSVKGCDRAMANELLQQSEAVLRQDPTIVMELGQAVETGGVYSSLSATATGGDAQQYKQLVLQFQIEGGNAWAQGVAYGIQKSKNINNSNNSNKAEIQLVSLEVANMDATINGTPFEISIPWKSHDK